MESAISIAQLLVEMASLIVSIIALKRANPSRKRNGFLSNKTGDGSPRREDQR